MSLIKISPGAKLTNSDITGNTQLGGDVMIDNQGEIDGANIADNLHIPNAAPSLETKPKFVDTAFGRVVIGLIILAIAGVASIVNSWLR